MFPRNGCLNGLYLHRKLATGVYDAILKTIYSYCSGNCTLLKQPTLWHRIRVCKLRNGANSVVVTMWNNSDYTYR